jgi:hypothetical protein
MPAEKKRQKLVDVACYDLAKMFLAEIKAPYIKEEERSMQEQELAEEIQRTIEDHISYNIYGVLDEKEG